MARKTPPSFDFYPDDFVGGTVHMHPIQVGMYVRYLCFQWNNKSIPNDREMLIRIAAISGDMFDENWPLVRAKFIELDDGSLVNERLYGEWLKAFAIRDARAEAGRKGGSSKARNLLVAKREQKLSKGKLEVGSRKKEEGSKEDGAGSRFRAPTSEEVETYASTIDYALDGEEFVLFYEQKGWKVGRSAMKCWKAAVRHWKKNGWGGKGAERDPRGNLAILARRMEARRNED